MSHAILSPSGASRWFACTPSARFEEKFPDKTSAFAQEGTVAHSLGELLIRQKLNWVDKKTFKAAFAEFEANEYYSEEMLEHCNDYADFVCEKFAEAQARTPDAKLFLEQRLDMTEYVPEGFGTGDAVIVADMLMETIDLKYGKGVAVNVHENKQQMLYALGALKDFDIQYDIQEVRMSVYQPRINNIASFIINKNELLTWAETELKAKAEQAFAGEGEYVPGDHCQFCRGRAVCKALADKNLELAAYEFKDPNMLDDTEIADVLSRAKQFTNWIGAVEDYAFDQALNFSKKWPGFKLVEGRSNRKYSDPDAVANALIGAKFSEEIIFTKKLLALTNLEKEIGKKSFNDIVVPFIIKPAGKPTLVPVTDKRPEFTGVESAVSDFAE
jgi:hypothetical protein